MKTASTIMILGTLLLQGCAAVAVGTAAVATKTAADPRSIGTQIDDSTLQLRVSNTLAKDQQIKHDSHIVVTVYQGKILLTGQAPNDVIISRAKQIALGVTGATEVYNEIRQGNKINITTASSDTWITTKVRSKLLSSDKVKSSHIKVTTEKGEVFLLGLVTQSEAEAAENIASKISGVKHVITAFTLLK